MVTGICNKKVNVIKIQLVQNNACACANSVVI